MQLDRKYILKLAQEILLIPSPSGYPIKIIPRIEKEANLYNLQTEKTKKGNLIITFPGKTDYKVG